jgi:hypothetical protein
VWIVVNFCRDSVGELSQVDFPSHGTHSPRFNSPPLPLQIFQPKQQRHWPRFKPLILNFHIALIQGLNKPIVDIVYGMGEFNPFALISKVKTLTLKDL